MDEIQVSLKLKDLVADHMGEVVPEVTKLDLSIEELNSKSPFELRAIAPKLDFGMLILRVLATSIKPKDAEDAGKLYTYIKSIRNKYETTGAEWKLDKVALSELKAQLKKAEGLVMAPMLIGQLWEKLCDLELELKEKESKHKK